MMKTIKSKLNQKGFSLIELMVVIVIMLILAAIAIPAFMGVVNDARVTKATSETRTVLMLAQLQVNKDEIVGADDYQLDVTTSNNGASDGETIVAILDQAAIPSEDWDYYSAKVDDSGAVSVTFNNGVIDPITLPE